MKKVINDTVVNFYKQPKKYDRSDVLSDNSDTAPIRNISTSGMNKTGGRSVGFSGTGDIKKDNKNAPKVTEKEEPKVIIDLEN